MNSVTSMDASMMSSAALLKQLDEIPVGRYHWKTVVTTGMGFFTDAYDLFSIGTVTAILQGAWHLSTWQVSMMNSTALLSAAIGALIFGYFMDRVGRQVMYGMEAVLLTVGALASALAPGYWMLIAARFLLGLGVGGDYPASAIIITEFANRQNRGRLVTSVFAMQGLGLVSGPLIALAVLHLGLATETAWRILLGIGAIPALLVIYLRRNLLETPRFTLHVQGDSAKTATIVRRVTGHAFNEQGIAPSVSPQTRATFARPPFLKRLFATAIAWFLIDIAFYGNGISSHIILSNLFPKASLSMTIGITLLLFVVTAFPGYVAAALAMDAMGRRTLQWIGFLVMSLTYGAVYIMPGLTGMPMAFIVLYGISYFFIEFGPNTTTFIYPSEIFPTHLRGQGHGIAAAAGKLGAFLAAFWFPVLLNEAGLRPLFGLLALVSLMGIWVTLQLLPEPKKRALEELNGVLDSPTVHRTYTRIMTSVHGDDLDKTIADELLELSGAELIAIHRLRDDAVLTLVARRANSLSLEQFADTLTVPVDTRDTLLDPRIVQIFSAACSRHEIVVENDLHDGWQTKHGSLIQLPGTQSVAVFPLIDRGRCFGALSIWDRGTHVFGSDRIHKLSTFVQVVAVALARTRQFLDVRQLAYTDALTQLRNRSGFETELELRIESGRNDPARVFAFAILDLDHFKQINDTHGHQRGDAALQAVSRHIQLALGPADVAARLGGDEFILLLEQVQEPVEAELRLRDLLGHLPLAEWGLGVSAGVCFFPADGGTYKELYRVADNRLYSAKNMGRGRIVARPETGQVRGMMTL